MWKLRIGVLFTSGLLGLFLAPGAWASAAADANTGLELSQAPLKHQTFCVDCPSTPENGGSIGPIKTSIGSAVRIARKRISRTHPRRHRARRPRKLLSPRRQGRPRNLGARAVFTLHTQRP